MLPSLDIVIVNWNAGAQLQQCLDSIRTASRDGFELLRVVVVDNASWDGSVDHLQPGGVPLSMIRNTINRGFAVACNQGAKDSRASYLLFLNPDIVLKADSLSTVVRFMESARNSKVAVCGAQLVDDWGQIAPTCSRFPIAQHFFAKMFGLNHLLPGRFQESLMSDWNHRETRPVDIVIGAFLLVRQQVFATLGGFDENFFVYYEEVDFLHEVHRTGWQSYYLTTAQAYHKGGGCSDQAKAARLFYSLRSRIIYCRKHFGWAPAAGMILATLLIEPFSRMAYAVVRGNVQDIGDTLKAYAMLLKWLATSAFKRKRPVPGRSNSNPGVGGPAVPRHNQWNSDVSTDVAEANSYGGQQLTSADYTPSETRRCRVWLVISSFQNDDDVIRILGQVHSFGRDVFERILVVDSQGTGNVPSLLADRGWDHVIYKSHPHNLGSGANLRERLRVAAEGGADYAYALNHDGSFVPEVMRTLLDAATPVGNLGAAYPLSYLTTAKRFNLTGTRELPLPAKLVESPPSGPLIDVFWSSSNGALYSTAPAKRGILPWPAMWMGWEDLEYGWRLSDEGYRQVIVRDAIYSDNYEYKQTWLAKTIDKPAWRIYYSFRNLILAVRRSRNRPLYYAVVTYRILLELALIVLVRDFKFTRLRSVCRGVWAGFTERVVDNSIGEESVERFTHPRRLHTSAEKQ
jgi:N-acetylglucosaminyl-diphospho-decaprenol L-rhamnosyltransferase